MSEHTKDRLYIRETFINETRGAQFGKTDWYETWTSDLGKLFKGLQRDYGAATTMYQDRPLGPPIKIGWVFRKRMRYDDARGNDLEKNWYTREVWVQVSLVEPKTERVQTVAPASPWGSAKV